MPDISVVALNYKTRDLLHDCLRSLLAHADGLDLEVIVVDNASGDGSAEMVREKFPQVALAVNEENVGYSRGTNRGIRMSSAPYILLLNPDTVVGAGALRGMYEYMESHADAAIVGPRMVGEDGDYQQSCFHFTLLDARHALLYLLVLLGGLGSSMFGMSTDPAGDGRCPIEVDWVYTACALVRARALEEVGLLDEGLFLYGEDMDLCYRVKRAGWKTVYLPGVEITHYGNRSGIQVFGEQKGYTRARIYVDGIDYFQRKYFSPVHSYIIRALICAGSAAAAAVLGALFISRRGDDATGARCAYAARVARASFISLLARRGAPGQGMKERRKG
ncbi:MAG: glycosyltransferase family 2 protein [Actinomycetota bacterium]